MTKITSSEKMIGFNSEMEVSVIKTMAGFIFEIVSNNKDIKIDLMEILF